MFKIPTHPILNVPSHPRRGRRSSTTPDSSWMIPPGVQGLEKLAPLNRGSRAEAPGLSSVRRRKMSRGSRIKKEIVSNRLGHRATRRVCPRERVATLDRRRSSVVEEQLNVVRAAPVDAFFTR